MLNGDGEETILGKIYIFRSEVTCVIGLHVTAADMY